MSRTGCRVDGRAWYRRLRLRVRRALRRRPSDLVLGMVIASALWILPVCARDWQADLADGRRISVDLHSNRAILMDEKGQGTPLWDGVHRLRDGRVIIVRSGLMVPNREVLTAREALPGEPVPVIVSACDQLMDKACGAHRACAATQACELAQQLREMQYSGAAPDPNEREWADTSCRQGLADDATFAKCEAPLRDEPGICQRLVRHLCGANDRCADSEGCEIAVQMLELEQAALRDGIADYAVDSRRQCHSVFQEHAYFPPCR